MANESELKYLSHPFSGIQAGPSACGKTMYTASLLNMDIIRPMPQRIYWCYSEYQDWLYQLLKDKVSFVKGFPDSMWQKIREPGRKLVIIDDQMDSLNDEIAQLFTKGCHHNNCSVIVLIQNLFSQHKRSRDISLNAHYIWLYKNPRDKSQITRLASQMFPGNVEYLTEAYEKATRKPYQNLLIDLKTTTPDRMRLRTNTLQENPTIFVSSKKQVE